MPKITTKQYSIAGKECSVQVWYNEQNLFHFKGFPAEVSRIAGNTEQYRLAHQPTSDALYFAAKEAIKLYEEKIKQTRKVIAYEVKAPENVKSIKKGYQTYPRENCDWVGYSGERDDFGFMVNYKVLFLIESGDKREFRSVMDDGTPGHMEHGGKGRIIDYTPEREKFFINLRSAFINLFDQAISYLHDPDKLILSIQSGQPLLGSAEEIV